MIASVTELRLKNFWCYLRFIPHAVKSKIQADQAAGVISTQVKSQGILIQRTLTVWDNKESMMNYIRTGAHLEAMKAFKTLANTSYTTHFEVTVPPTWDEALHVLKEKGRAHHA